MADATDEDYRNWAIALNRIEDEIKAKNEEKRNLYVEIRNSFSPTTANALKDAMKLCRMDKGKRDEALELHKEARRVLAILTAAPSGAESALATAIPATSDPIAESEAMSGVVPALSESSPQDASTAALMRPSSRLNTIDIDEPEFSEALARLEADQFDRRQAKIPPAHIPTRTQQTVAVVSGQHAGGHADNRSGDIAP